MVDDGGEPGPNESRMSSPPGGTETEEVDDTTRVRDGPQTAPVEERDGPQTEPVEDRGDKQTEPVEERSGRQSFVPARGGESNIDSSVSDDDGDEPPTRERDGPQTPPPEEVEENQKKADQEEPRQKQRGGIRDRLREIGAQIREEAGQRSPIPLNRQEVKDRILAAGAGVKQLPRDAEDREILRQVIGIDQMSEGGFTEAERQAAEVGQQRIATREAEQDIEEAEEQISVLGQQVQDIRQLEEGTPVTVTRDGSSQTVTRDEALSILSEEREQLQSEVETARDQLGDPDQRVRDLAERQEDILEEDPMQGMTTEATLEDASPTEAAFASVSPTGFSIAASNVIGGLDAEEETARAIQKTRSAGPVERTIQVLGSPLGVVATGGLAGKTFQVGVRGLAAVSQTAGAVGLRGGQAAGVGITALEAQKVAEDVEEGDIRSASIRAGQFISGSAGFAAGAASGAGIPSFSTGRSVSNVRGGRGEVLLSETRPLQTRSFARTRTAPDEVSRALAQDVSSTAPRPSSSVPVRSRLVRSQEFMESQIGRRLSPSEDLPYTQPAPAEVAGTTGTTARGAGQQDFMATVTESQGPLTGRIFRPTRRTEEVTAVMDQVTATRGAATGTGQVASQRAVPLSDRITLGAREQSRLLRTQSEGLGFEPAGRTTMQGEPFRFSSRTLLRSVGQDSETAPGLARVTDADNPFSLKAQRFVLPEQGASPRTSRVGATDMIETRGSFDGTPFTGRRTVTRSGEIDAVVSEEPLNLYSRGRQGTSFRGESGSFSRTQEVMGGAGQVTETVSVSPELVSNIRGMDASFIRATLQQGSDTSGLTPVAFTTSRSQTAETGTTTDRDTDRGDGQDLQVDTSQDRIRYSIETRQDTTMQQGEQGGSGQRTVAGVGTDLSFTRESLETDTRTEQDIEVGPVQGQGRSVEARQRSRGQTQDLNVPAVASASEIGQRLKTRTRQKAVSRVDTPAPRQRSRTTRAAGGFDLEFDTMDIGFDTGSGDRRAEARGSDRLPQLDVLTASIVEGRTGTATAPREPAVLERFSEQRRQAGPLAELPALEQVQGRTDAGVDTGFDLDVDLSFTGGDDFV